MDRCSSRTDSTGADCPRHAGNKVKRSIVIPLYDHTDEEEILEIMDRLAEMGFALTPYVKEEK